jgi:hypothetical protein
MIKKTRLMADRQYSAAAPNGSLLRVDWVDD